MMFIFQKLRSFALYSLLVLVFCLGTLLRVFPFFKRLISNAIDSMFGLKIPQDDYWDTMFSQEMLKGLWRFIFLDINKKTKLGAKAYNSPLFSLDGKMCFRLLETSKRGRPLVVNFGSSSWRPFLAKLREFGEIVHDFADIADFVIVYIEEAHPSDGWAFKVSLSCFIVDHYPDNQLKLKTESSYSHLKIIHVFHPCKITHLWAHLDYSRKSHYEFYMMGFSTSWFYKLLIKTFVDVNIYSFVVPVSVSSAVQHDRARVVLA